MKTLTTSIILLVSISSLSGCLLAAAGVGAETAYIATQEAVSYTHLTLPTNREV